MNNPSEAHSISVDVENISIDQRIEFVCSKQNYKREQISFPSGTVEVVNGLEIDIPGTIWQDFLQQQDILLNGKSSRLSCMQVSAGACLRGWTDGVITTYESKMTEELVGSTNHALAWKEIDTACVAIDFTARNTFKTKHKPNVFIIIAKDKNHLKQIIGQIYGNDGVNDEKKLGWGDQNQTQVAQNKKTYLKRFGNLKDKIFLGIKLKMNT